MARMTQMFLTIHARRNGDFLKNFIPARVEIKISSCICALRGLGKGIIPLVEGDSLHGSLGSSPRMTEIISIRGKELSP